MLPDTIKNELVRGLLELFHDDFFIASKKDAETQFENAKVFLNTVDSYLQSIQFYTSETVMAVFQGYFFGKTCQYV